HQINITLFSTHIYAHYHPLLSHFFFFNATSTTEIYTLSLHDALPISDKVIVHGAVHLRAVHQSRQRVGHHQFSFAHERIERREADRKSTRLNSSHDQISYAVFCLKKKKKKKKKK